MAEEIRKINKQIASFVLLSAALALPTASTSAAANDLIADASFTVNPQSSIQTPMVFYASPSIPQETINIGPGAPQIDTPMMFYASPSIPVNIEPVAPIQPPMAFYASPSVPVDVTPVAPVQPPMAFYASPSIPTIQEANVKINPPVVEPISSNVIEQNIVSNIKQNVPQAATLKPVYRIAPNPNVKTEGFVNSEYGTVKIVEPYKHFIFK